MLNIIRNIALVCVFSFLMFSMSSISVLAQEGSGENCGINRIRLENLRLLYLDAMMNPKESKYSEDTKVIIIASLGSKETNRKYNVERLKEMKDYISSSAVGIPDDIIILAQGENRKDLGRIEVYYGGILQHYINFKPKGRLYLTGGEPCMY